MTNEISPEAARAALASAATTREAVQAEGRWMATYMLSFGLGFGAAALLLGLIENFWLRMGLFLAIWITFVLVMVRWASTRLASARTQARRVAGWWVGTSVLFAVVLFLGTERFQGQLSYWLPAAALIAAPLVIGGLLERRK